MTVVKNTEEYTTVAGKLKNARQTYDGQLTQFRSAASSRRRIAGTTCHAPQFSDRFDSASAIVGPAANALLFYIANLEKGLAQSRANYAAADAAGAGKPLPPIPSGALASSAAQGPHPASISGGDPCYPAWWSVLHPYIGSLSEWPNADPDGLDALAGHYTKLASAATALADGIKQSKNSFVHLAAPELSACKTSIDSVSDFASAVSSRATACATALASYAGAVRFVRAQADSCAQQVLALTGTCITPETAKKHEPELNAAAQDIRSHLNSLSWRAPAAARGLVFDPIPLPRTVKDQPLTAVTTPMSSKPAVKTKNDPGQKVDAWATQVGQFVRDSVLKNIKHYEAERRFTQVVDIVREEIKDGRAVTTGSSKYQTSKYSDSDIKAARWQDRKNPWRQISSAKYWKQTAQETTQALKSRAAYAEYGKKVVSQLKNGPKDALWFLFDENWESKTTTITIDKPTRKTGTGAAIRETNTNTHVTRTRGTHSLKVKFGGGALFAAEELINVNNEIKDQKAIIRSQNPELSESEIDKKAKEKGFIRGTSKFLAGAVVGAAVGSLVPGAGTAAGFIIGAAVGYAASLAMDAKVGDSPSINDRVADAGEWMWDESLTLFDGDTQETMSDGASAAGGAMESAIDTISGIAEKTGDIGKEIGSGIKNIFGG